MSVPGVLILSRCLNFRLMQSKTISRVMSCVIIYPMELSPVPLSDPPENMTGSHIRFLFGLASDGVYMAFSVTRETVVSYTAFPPLPQQVRRFISVALVWESPPPDVIRHPALRSPDFPRLNPFVCSAAITWPGCASAILARFFALVKKFHSTILHIKAASADKFS